MAVERLFGAYVDSAGALLIGYVHEACSRIDGARGAYYEEHRRAVEPAIDDVHVERYLAEPDDVRTHGLTTGFTSRKSVRGLVGFAVRKGQIAADAARLKKASVHVVDTLRAGTLVQIVYVLGAEVEAVAQSLLDGCEGFVSGVGLGGESVVAAHGVKAPDELRVNLPGFGRGDVFDAISVPEATGAAKGCKAAFSRDACSREDKEMIG